MTPKQQIQRLLDQVPEHATFQEIQDYLNSRGGHGTHRRREQPSNLQVSSSSEDLYKRWQDLVSI